MLLIIILIESVKSNLQYGGLRSAPHPLADKMRRFFPFEPRKTGEIFPCGCAGMFTVLMAGWLFSSPTPRRIKKDLTGFR